MSPNGGDNPSVPAEFRRREHNKHTKAQTLDLGKRKKKSRGLFTAACDVTEGEPGTARVTAKFGSGGRARERETESEGGGVAKKKKNTAAPPLVQIIPFRLTRYISDEDSKGDAHKHAHTRTHLCQCRLEFKSVRLRSRPASVTALASAQQLDESHPERRRRFAASGENERGTFQAVKLSAVRQK